MVVFPNCKINIGLRVLDKRADNYHELHTIFYPVNLTDALEILPNPGGDTSFQSTGFSIDGPTENNLCLKAINLLRKEYPNLPTINMYLHKAIPLGAGLGGGSSDAAFTLKLINEQFSLGLTQIELLNYALQLGSDCPFFILNKPAFASGRGEILKEVSLDLSGYKIVLVNPVIHINTAKAFSQLIKSKYQYDLLTAIALPVDQWQKHIINDFETGVFETYPEIAELKNYLSQQGAIYTSMTGTGSTVYGLFAKEAQPPLNFPAHYFYKWV